MATKAASTAGQAAGGVTHAVGGVVHAAANPAEALASTGAAVSGLVHSASNQRRSLLRVVADYSIGFRLAVLASLGILVFAGTALVQTLLYRRRTDLS